MAGSVVFAMLADRIGRRPSILLAVLLFGAFTFLIPVATNLWELGILRFCAAFGVGGAMPMAIALISDYSKSTNRGLLITLLYLGYTSGSAGGGLLAAEMIPDLGWRRCSISAASARWRLEPFCSSSCRSRCAIWR